MVGSLRIRLETVAASVALCILATPPASIAAEPGCPGSASPDPARLHCDDFDDGRPISEKWSGYESQNGSFAPIEAVGVDGSTAMRARYEAGQVSVGRVSIGLGQIPPYYLDGGENWRHVVSPTSKFREIFWREYVRFEAGWQGIARKHSRLRVLDDPAPDDPGPHRTAFQAHFWPDNGPNNAFVDGALFFNNTRGVDDAGTVIDRGNNTNTSVWLPRTAGTTRLFKSYPAGSEWICIEAHVKLNDPGLANGIEEFWVDGALEARRTDQDHIGRYDTYGLNQVVFDNYWNGGSPQQNTLYRDNIVVSTERIGCLSDAPPPPPPAALPAPYILR